MGDVAQRLAISLLTAVLAVATLPLEPDAAGTMAFGSERVRVSTSTAWASPLADAASTLVVIDAPRGGTTGTILEVRGWAADPTARSGTGVDRVEVYLDGERDAGGTRLGQATYGLQRPDIAAHLGSQQFLLSGYALQATVSPGPHTIYVYAHPSDQPPDEGWSAPTTLAVLVGPAGPRVVAGQPLPPHCAGVPVPYGGVYPVETPQSYGAIYPPDVPLVFGNPALWATYGNPNAPAYVDFRDGTVYLNSYFYQPRPARGIPIAC